MVFISGPRQCGKTTLAGRLLRRRHGSAPARYLNWDDDEARTRVVRSSCDPLSDLSWRSGSLRTGGI
jgi:predicted AAA+ superfamily ATPase